MATSIAAQLKAIKSAVRGGAEPSKKPSIRPSIIYDPKSAADIDLRTIHENALPGLDDLAGRDARFGRYKDTLFSSTSLELDRETMTPKEEDKLNLSIRSYLLLLSGHLELPAARRTLEYLIRRYQVHIFNVNELVLCALPYHDTQLFVRIVQLLDLGNKQWAFLQGVKESGAPPPRKVIVQQCIRDKGVLETLCNYATPTKNFQHPRPVICFCTAVVVEALGSIPKLDTDIVNRIISFVFDGLNPSMKGCRDHKATPTKNFQHPRPVICFCTAVVVEALGSIPKLDTDIVNRIISFVFDGLNPSMKGCRDHKAGALMIVGLLATRAVLTSKLVQSLVFSIARMAEHDAKQSVDLPWLRVAIMAIVSLVQSQLAEMMTKKTVMIFNEIRDFIGVLYGLSQEFNIQKFLRLYLQALLEYSGSDSSCRLSLISMVETLPLKEFVERIVLKVLSDDMKLSRSVDTPHLPEAGKWAEQILLVIDKHYPSELRQSVCKFSENSKMGFREDKSTVRTFCSILNGNMDVPTEISCSKLWFSLEHPKAAVRQATLSSLAASGALKDMTANSKNFRDVQDIIVRRLHDDDLSVVEAALSIDNLPGIIHPSTLFKSYCDILLRCLDIIKKSTSKSSKASEVAIYCLEHMVWKFKLHQLICPEEVAKIIFPLLLIFPKTWKVNMKALELARHIQWPLYCDSSLSCDSVCFEQIKTSGSGHTAINMKTIGTLSESFLKSPHGHIQWLFECSSHSELSKSFFLLLILQAFDVHNEDSGCLLELYKAASHYLKLEWKKIESQTGGFLADDVILDILSKSSSELVDQLLSSDFETLNIRVLICIYWRVAKTVVETINRDTFADSSAHISILEELFLFFAKSPSRNAFRKHLDFVLKNCSKIPLRSLVKYFAEEDYSVEIQIQSLHWFQNLCSITAPSERSNTEENCHLQLLLGFPSMLVPLANDDKDIRLAAIKCIEAIHKLCQHLDISRLKNGNDTILSHISTVTFADFLEAILMQNKLILSDVNFLPSFLTSLLGPSPGLLVPENIHKRFDQQAKDALLHFILSIAVNFSSYGKLMVLTLLKGTGNAMLLVNGVKLLLFDLLEKRDRYHLGFDRSDEKLSTIETKVLCILLEARVSNLSSIHVDADIISCLIKSLRVDGPSDDPVVMQPCISVLQNLTCASFDSLKADIQDDLFCKLVFLFRADNADVRNEAREALLRINITSSTVVKLLELILAEDDQGGSLKRTKRDKFVPRRSSGLHQSSFNIKENKLACLESLLDVLLLKKHMEKRDSLLSPLFNVLRMLFSGDWLQHLGCQVEQGSRDLCHYPESVRSLICYARQTTLLILKDITDSLSPEQSSNDEIYNKANMNLLIDCARTAEDPSTRNHVFVLLSSIARVSSEWILEHIIDIFTVIGESVVKQSDNHSQCVVEDLISTLVPCWLSKTKSLGKLFQIFIETLPEVAEFRRLTLMVYLLKTLEEKRSLGMLVAHLFRSLILRINGSSKCGHQLLCSSTVIREWEYVFAVQLFNQYSCEIWFPCLVDILQEVGNGNSGNEVFAELVLTVKFVLQKLQDTNVAFELEARQDADYLQMTLRGLMEQVVLQLQLVSARGKQLGITKDAMQTLKGCADSALKIITRWMVPSAFFTCITQLLGYKDVNVKKKTLALLCETVKDRSSDQRKHIGTGTWMQKSSVFPRIDETATPSFSKLCFKIVELIDDSADNSSIPVKLSAISSLEVLAKEFPSGNVISSSSLECVVKHIGSTNLAISAGCLRATGTFIDVLGPKSLSQLPHVMKHLSERAHEICTCPIGKSRRREDILDGVSTYRIHLLLSLLITLESVIENLAGFLNPYLEDILDLVVLHPEYTSEADAKLKLKAATVRRLLTQKIPARLMVAPLVKIYPNSLRCGESSISLVFEMLADMIGAMERSSIGSYHLKIYEQCLIALDLRRQLPETVSNINVVEQSVILAMITLTGKLTETMFRPLFFHSLEWAETELEGAESERRSLDRAISFFKLVNDLVMKHRSLFVPYFKYLIEGCIRYLAEDYADSVTLTKKRKKAKVCDAGANNKDVLSPKQWYLRALILKALYQCFLYDTAELKFLDASNFQVLLKPIVSQLVVESPTSFELSNDIPSVEEVDESLVLCLGQMAVTAHSDVLWKSLNHEVLMHTRNEKIRPRILGLKVVKFLVEHLKEEYLVFLPETIPFLGELLEDVEPSVKSLAQEILREMEILSGESLWQYL